MIHLNIKLTQNSVGNLMKKSLLKKDKEKSISDRKILEKVGFSNLIWIIFLKVKMKKQPFMMILRVG